MKSIQWQDVYKLGDTIRAVARFLMGRMKMYRLPQVAGSLSFTTVLSLVPLLVVALAILTGFPVFERFQTEIQQFMLENLMPEKMSRVIMKQINQFADQSSRLSWVGGVSLLISSLMTMGTIDSVFNDIWQVKQRGLMRKNVLVYWAVLTAGPIFFGAMLIVSSYLIHSLKTLPFLSNVLSFIVPFLSAMFAFAALFVFVPNRKVRWQDALVGGFVSGLFFIILIKGFAIGFRQFQSYAVIYSAFSILPAFFIWLYVFWWVILLGAALTASLPILKYERWRKETRVGDDLPEALMILYILYQAQHSPAHMVSWSSLQVQLKLNSEDLERIVSRLQKYGLVGKICLADDSTGWALICDTADVTMADLYDIFVFDSQYFAAKAQQADLPWASLFTGLHHSAYLDVHLNELFEK